MSKETNKRLAHQAITHLEDAIDNWSRVGKKYVKVPDYYLPVVEEIKEHFAARGITYNQYNDTLNWKL